MTCRCPMCIDQIRREVVIAFNGFSMSKDRQRELLAGFDARVDAITFEDHASLVGHLVTKHGWRPYTGTLAERSQASYHGR